MAIYGYPRENANTGPDLSAEPIITWDLPTAALTNSKLINPGQGIAIQISGANVTIIATGSSGAIPGTVYDFSAGNLSPVFTTAVASSTTTPNLTFSLTTQTSGKFFSGPQTGAAAAPTFRTITGDDLAAAIQAGSNIIVTNNGSTITITGVPPTSGTVTSVGLALPNIFSISGSPVINSGTLTGTLVSQPCNYAFIGPSAGANTTPTFRPLVGNDLTAIVAGTNTTVTNNGSTIQVNAPNALGGTVTTVSDGDLNPIFTTNVANPTTTPAITHSLITQSSGTMLMGPSSGSTPIVPSFRHITGNDLVDAVRAGSNVTITNNGTYLSISASGGGGSGSVTDFSAGDASPLFTTNVATSTTTPALTFTITPQASGVFFGGPGSGSSATPSFRAILGSDVFAALEAGSNISLVNMGSTVKITASDQYTGTVTSVAVGNLAPLFTTNVSNPTTTPSAAYTLVQQPCNTFFRGPSSGANGDPWFGRITGNDLSGVIQNGTNTTVTNNGATFQINANAGTVTSVSADDSPIFTTTETNPTTTPNISFSLVNQPSATAFMGPSAGSAGEPWFRVFTGNDLINSVRAGSNVTVTNNGDYISIASTASGGGGGTVTDFSAGNLSPLFTTNVGSSTTTPALTFTLTSQTSGVFFCGPSAGSAAGPTFRNIVGQDIYSALEAGSNITLTPMGSTVKITASDQYTGTVTNVSVGNLSPLFTSNTANPTTTPSTTYTLVNQPCNLVFIGPASGADAAPTFRGIIGNDLSNALVNGTNSVVVNNGNTIQVNVPNALGGTVTSFSAGDFNPLFTTSEATPTTTPALTFNAVTQDPNLFFCGGPSGSAAAPGFRGIIGNDLSAAIVAGTNTTVTNNGNTFQVNAPNALGGTVTDVAVGSLAPVFTSNTSNPTTTPSTTFSLVSQPCNTFFRGPSSGANGEPWFGLLTGNDLAPVITAGTNTTVTNSGATFQINGNAGTVTSFSAGDFSPLFTTSEASPTTTPALTFNVINQDPNLVFISPPSGSAGAPGFRGLIGNDLALALVPGTNTTVTNNGNTIQVNAADQYTGTVTNVSVGDLVPFFTSNTSNPTTTPSTTFTLTNAPPNTFWRGPSSQPAGTPWYGILTGNDLASAVVAGTNTTVTNNGATIQINGNAGTVTSFSAGDFSPLFTTSEANPTTTPALTFNAVTQAATKVFIGPQSGGDAAPTFRILTGDDLAATLVAGTNTTVTNNGATIQVNGNAGTVTNFSAGDLAPLFTTSESTTTTTPALSFTLSNAPSGTFLGGPSSGADGAPWYRKIQGADIYPALTQGSNITLTNNGDTVTIAAAAGGSNTDYTNSFLLMGG